MPFILPCIWAGLAFDVARAASRQNRTISEATSKARPARKQSKRALGHEVFRNYLGVPEASAPLRVFRAGVWARVSHVVP